MLFRSMMSVRACQCNKGVVASGSGIREEFLELECTLEDECYGPRPGSRQISLQERIATLDISGALCKLGTEGRGKGLTYKGNLDFVRVDDQAEIRWGTGLVKDCFSSREQE